MTGVTKGALVRHLIGMRFALGVALLVAVACGPAPAPAPVLGSPLAVPQLKFAVMDAVGKPVFCDPDFYPVGRPEMPTALAQYPTIKGDTETYSAIVAHEHLPSSELTDDQKLTVYRAWKLLRAVDLVAAGNQYTFQYRVQSKTGSAAYEMVGGGVLVDGMVTISSRAAAGPPNCPICLAASVLIATPDGPLRVTEIRVGMVVWTQAAGGSRVAAPVLEVGSMEAPQGHMVVHLVLADGREVQVSPGHKTADGRAVGSLRVGDSLDGSTVTVWELVPYTGGKTYDLLPAGATGRYWANGILLSSTLRTAGHPQ